MRRWAVVPACAVVLAGCRDREVRGDSRGGASSGVSVAATPARSGADVYAGCAVCHMHNGEGVRGVYPSLVATDWVTGSADRLVAIIVAGVQGAMQVHGDQFDSPMMPYGMGPPLSDAEVAAVATYVRGAWGNAAAPVNSDDVARVRLRLAGRRGPLTPATLDSIARR